MVFFFEMYYTKTTNNSPDKIQKQKDSAKEFNFITKFERLRRIQQGQIRTM